MERYPIRAAAELSLFKNIVFSAAGGVAGNIILDFLKCISSLRFLVNCIATVAYTSEPAYCSRRIGCLPSRHGKNSAADG